MAAMTSVREHNTTRVKCYYEEAIVDKSGIPTLSMLRNALASMVTHVVTARLGRTSYCCIGYHFCFAIRRIFQPVDSLPRSEVTQVHGKPLIRNFVVAQETATKGLEQ